MRRFIAGVSACAAVALAGLIDEEVAYWAALPLLAGTIYLQVARGWTAFSVGVGSGVALAILIAGVCLLLFGIAMRGF